MKKKQQKTMSINEEDNIDRKYKFRFILDKSLGIDTHTVLYIKSLEGKKLEIGILNYYPNLMKLSNRGQVNLIDDKGVVIEAFKFYYKTYEVLPFDFDYRSNDFVIYRIIFNGVRYDKVFG